MTYPTCLSAPQQSLLRGISAEGSENRALESDRDHHADEPADTGERDCESRQTPLKTADRRRDERDDHRRRRNPARVVHEPRDGRKEGKRGQKARDRPLGAVLASAVGLLNAQAFFSARPGASTGA